MRTLFEVIIDELANYDVQLMTYPYKCEHGDNILSFTKFNDRMTIRPFDECIPLVNSSLIQYYKIPSNLSFDKIMNIIRPIFVNNYLTNTKFSSTECVSECTKYIKILYYSRIIYIWLVGLNTTNANSITRTNLSDKLIFGSDAKDFESIISNEIEKFNNFEILYKL